MGSRSHSHSTHLRCLFKVSGTDLAFFFRPRRGPQDHVSPSSNHWNAEGRERPPDTAVMRQYRLAQSPSNFPAILILLLWVGVLARTWLRLFDRWLLLVDGLRGFRRFRRTRRLAGQHVARLAESTARLAESSDRFESGHFHVSPSAGISRHWTTGYTSRYFSSTWPRLGARTPAS